MVVTAAISQDDASSGAKAIFCAENGVCSGASTAPKPRISPISGISASQNSATALGLSYWIDLQLPNGELARLRATRDCARIRHRLSATAATTTSRATIATASHSSGNVLSTALPSNAFPYRASSVLRRYPLSFCFYESANYFDAEEVGRTSAQRLSIPNATRPSSHIRAIPIGSIRLHELGNNYLDARRA